MCNPFSNSSIRKIETCLKKALCLNKDQAENLRRMSFFGRDFSFSINRRKKYRTFVGGIFTFLIWIFSAYYFIFLLQGYIPSSLINDVITFTTFEQKSADDVSGTLKIIFWISKLDENGKKSVLSLEDYSKYLKIGATYTNEFENKTLGKRPYKQTMDLVECEKSGDKIVEKLLRETTQVKLKGIKPKICLIPGERKYNITVNKDVEMNKMNFIYLRILHCKKTKETPECDLEERKKSKFFISYALSYRNLDLSKAGRNVTFWAKQEDMIHNYMDIAFRTFFIDPDSNKKIRMIFNHFYQVRANYDFQSLANVIKKIPIIGKIILKLLFDSQDNLIGYKLDSVIDSVMDFNHEGLGIGLNMYNMKKSYRVEFLSIIRFLSSVRKKINLIIFSRW